MGKQKHLLRQEKNLNNGGQTPFLTPVQFSSPCQRASLKSLKGAEPRAERRPAHVCAAAAVTLPGDKALLQHNLNAGPHLRDATSLRP